MKFNKYHGTGNDFVLIDNRGKNFNGDKETVRNLCSRHFGIGADGLMLLEEAEGYDFRMVYFNSDGGESTMCGNGGRCLVQFAHELGMVAGQCQFLAIDGPHRAIIKNDTVSLGMKDVRGISIDNNAYVLDTGSPHYVEFVEGIGDLNVVGKGRAIRYSERFTKEGVNVNFAEVLSGNRIVVRTYERGVEDETLSCGTGVVASAIAFSIEKNLQANSIHIKTPGGELEVSFKKYGNEFSDIWLKGPAVKVFEGNF